MKLYYILLLNWTFKKRLSVIYQSTVAGEITQFLIIVDRNFSTTRTWSKQIMHCTTLSLRLQHHFIRNILLTEQSVINVQHDAPGENGKYVLNQIGNALGCGLVYLSKT